MSSAHARPAQGPDFVEEAERDELRSLVAASGAAYPGCTLCLLIEARARAARPPAPTHAHPLACCACEAARFGPPRLAQLPRDGRDARGPVHETMQVGQPETLMKTMQVRTQTRRACGWLAQRARACPCRRPAARTPPCRCKRVNSPAAGPGRAPAQARGGRLPRARPGRRRIQPRRRGRGGRAPGGCVAGRAPRARARRGRRRRAHPRPDQGAGRAALQGPGGAPFCVH